MKLDVVIVATRRPELLAGTLGSFDKNLFRQIEVGTLYLNIDPLWGAAADEIEMERLCRAVTPAVTVRKPPQPSFGGAVKWLWAQPQSSWFLHLEDDWLLLKPLDLGRLTRQMAEPGMVQVGLGRNVPWHRAWQKSVYTNRFTTGPSFVQRDFGHLASAHMQPDLDPEKQLSWDDLNPELRRRIKGYKKRFMGTRFSASMIEDTGRAWREARSIEKRLENGKSVWR